MTLREISIAKAPPGKKRKTRIFRQRLLGYIRADSLWNAPATDTAPVWMAYAGSPQEARAFTANLQGGARAELGSTRIKLPKKASYRWATTRLDADTVATVVYLPQLLDLEPASAFTDRVRFVFAVPRWWTAEQGESEHEACAALFAAYADRRTPYPILPDRSFLRRLYDAATDEPWFRAYDDGGTLSGAIDSEALGLAALASIDTDHDTFADFLAAQTAAYFEEEHPNGTTWLPHVRGLLPDTTAPVAQLSFAFGMA